MEDRQCVVRRAVAGVGRRRCCTVTGLGAGNPSGGQIQVRQSVRSSRTLVDPLRNVATVGDRHSAGESASISSMPGTQTGGHAARSKTRRPKGEA